MTPDLICAIVGIILWLGLRWIVNIDWDEYNKVNSGQETKVRKGTKMNNSQFTYFAKNPIEFLAKLNLRTHQIKSVSYIQESDLNTVNAWCRRSGKDTLIAACALHSAIFKPYSTVVIYVPAAYHISYFENTLRELIHKLIPDADIIKKSHTFRINNSKIIIKSIQSRIESSNPDIIFFNECTDEKIIERTLDLERVSNTTFHIFATGSIILDKIYPAKYTKVTWRDVMPIEEAMVLRNQIGKDYFSKDME